LRASQFVDYEIPNEHTRVGRLIKSIVSRDPSIVSAITHIQGNLVQRDDFESAADFLLLTAPKFKDSTQTHRVSAVRSHKSKRKGAGKSGVEFRYHSRQEYIKLNKAQKKELSDWRKSNNDDKENNPGHKVSALEQQIAEMKQQTELMKQTIASLTTNTLNADGQRHPLTNPLTQRVN